MNGPSAMNAVTFALFPAIGGIVGAVYFVLLRKTARLHAARAATARIVPLYILRIFTAVIAFWIVAQQGALPLLLSLAGFLAARYVIQYRTGWE